jgi:LPS-assembly protein
VPIFYLPYLRHPMDETGRESGFLIPTPENSSTKGLVLGEQYYWVISRNMDMIVGLDYYSKRGWAPNGDFRYKGPGLDHAAVRWNALLDRGIEELVTPAATSSNPMPTPVMQFVNQGGVDITALGRKDLTPETRLAGNIDYLSSYLYRLVFNDNYWLAVSSEVLSSLSLTHAHRGFIPSISLDRFQSFAGTTATSDEASVNGNQARILHTPSLRFDVLDRPLRTAPLYWGMGSSLDFLTRSEPGFHARNTGRIDFYPHLTLPLNGGGWSLVAQGALRETAYTLSQIPGTRSSGSSAIPSGTPTISHDPLNRTDFEGSVDLRPPAIERDFSRDHGNRQLRHVLEPEFTYRYVTGIGSQAQNVLLVDTTDIASNTNEVGYSLTQRFYLHTNAEKPCPPEDTDTKGCSTQAREWASWQIAQKYYLDPNFGGALILHRRNVFDSTLDLSGIAFLTSPRNLAPVISRLRFEAVHNLRVQWDLDYNPRDGEFGADNLFAGYSWGRTTIGVTHALLNAVDENGAHATTIKSQQIQPFFSIGKPSGKGFNLAANGGYDYVLNALQYAGAEAVYNWDCCGLSFGYRRFELGSIRNETTWLYSFTLANFGSVPGINRTKSVFRDPSLPPAY